VLLQGDYLRTRNRGHYCTSSHSVVVSPGAWPKDNLLAPCGPAIITGLFYLCPDVDILVKP